MRGRGRSPVLAVAKGLIVALLPVAGMLGTKHLFAMEAVWREWYGDATWIVATVSGALFLAWLVLRSSPPLLPAVPLDERERESLRALAARRTMNFARWFIVMRWIAVLTAATLAFIAVRIAGLLPPHLWWPLLVAIVALAVLNGAYIVLMRRGWLGQRLLLIQVHGDLVLLTVMLHFSGGIENPLSLLMILHVIIGGIVLERRQCYYVVAVATVLLSTMAALEGFGAIHHYTLQVFPHEGADPEHAALHPLFAVSSVTLQAMLFSFTAFFVTNLAERLRQDERQLEQMANRAVGHRQLLERALETTNTGLRVLEPDLTVQWASSRWRSWFPPESAEQIDALDSGVAKTFLDRCVRIEEFVLDGGGEADADADSGTIIQITTAPLPDTGGRVPLVVELARDVSRQRRIQREMIRAGKLAAVGELAGQVAHEVNNPIAIISGKTRLLLANHRAEMSEKMEAELRKITDLADRVARIAQGLLSSSRPTGAPRGPVDVAVPIRRALGTIEQLAAGRGVSLVDRLPETMPAVRANGHEMEQVFLNLFLNAIDAMAEGGELVVAAADDGVALEGHPAVRVSVEDTGHGVPADIRHRIFDPFFTTKEVGRGTGLGLTVCRGLVESHGGEIGVTSRPRRGTRVTVTLPVAGSDSQENPGA